MPRPRKHNRHLPACMYLRRGAYYYVNGGTWHPLGKSYPAALVKYAEFVGDAPKLATVKDAVWGYIEASRGRLAEKTLEGPRVAGILRDFRSYRRGRCPAG